MKWSIVGLVLLGILAAVSAAFLVAGLLAGRQATAPASTPPPAPVAPEVDVLVAAADLEAMTRLGAGDLEVQRISRELLPEGAYSSPLQATGKLLILPVKEGQALTASLFASEGSLHQLAAAIGEGERVVSVNLSDSMGIEAFLYPGCSVDVLASLTLKADEGLGEQRVSMTLLEGVTVLAVGERTIVEGDRPERPAPQPGGRLSAGPRPSVALLVTPRQAEALKLAAEEGSVTLVMRNPTDAGTHPAEATRLPALSPTIAELEQLKLERDRAERAARQLLADLERAKAEWDHERAGYGIERARGDSALDQRKLELEELGLQLELAEKARSTREVTVLRGGAAESRTFDQPAPQP